MFKVTKYPHGTFSWADCSSTDVDAGKKFYCDVMGWTTEDIPMGNDMFYTFFKQDGETVAAISPMQPAMQAQGVPSMWNSYITVDDVDALIPRIKELGGTVMGEPMDVFDDGRMVVLQDPTGAVVSLWQAKNHIGASLVNTVGAMCWNELYTSDTDAARTFYAELLGWDFEKMAEEGNYWLGKVNGRMNCGITSLPEGSGEMPPNWGIYFTVADIDAATEKVKESGGTVHSGPFMAEGVGRMAIISDPCGATINIIQTENPDPWEE